MRAQQQPPPTPPPSSPEFGSRDKIGVLFKEYDALRVEIQNRTNHGYQLWGIGAGVLALIVSRPLDLRFWILSGLFLVVFLLASWTSVRDIIKAAKRIRELEDQINHLAGVTLLEWEHRWGSAVTGFWRTRPVAERNSN